MYALTKTNYSHYNGHCFPVQSFSSTHQYLRLSDDTPIEHTMEMLKKHWHMTGANLVITVIGGAKNFNLDGKKKEVFNRGLVTVSSTSVL